ncbi:PIG-L deacetylase family protein [Methylobacterium organophilum]|uniref:1D-myo-inositol 2-acetamido-2-deoxy-alpha-D-glucopyranoside deacetylase n=1 Tax=Methylobacterium organophilum TaxID=410 RepID=A0ABQ4TFK7_METOR|nr:PIG-L family deacetylase [Methylobacterium organophilum]GJE29094.1 1D-myo-inositol 2-acetamido-2-deoxy-alpha-D-glucopyranoside deacetylase [Methylobacterium organophilum]
MRADAFLAAAETLPFADLRTLAGGGGLVVIAPHPDDESLGCGGLIAQARARGMPVRLVVVSDGAGSHPNSPSYPPERLRALREAETLAAGRALGLDADSIHFLGLPDRFVPASGPAAESAAEAIAALARACGASALFVTWAHDPHGDHQAAAALAGLARRRLGDVRLFAYPIWGWTLPGETEVGAAPRGVRLDIAGELAAKGAAIAAHRSQTTDLIDDDPDGFRLEPTMLARFARPFEIFLEMRP